MDGFATGYRSYAQVDDQQRLQVATLGVISEFLADARDLDKLRLERLQLLAVVLRVPPIPRRNGRKVTHGRVESTL